MILQVVLATKNLDKVKEIIEIIPSHISIKTLGDFGFVCNIDEDGSTIEENSQKKAIEVAKLTLLPSIADDTGLFVDGLGGKPGVYSSRYAGEDASYEDNIKKLLEDMKDLRGKERVAYFRCAATIALPGGRFITKVGEIKGIITLTPRGNGGFGYDPVFYVPRYHMTFAEMPLELKNKISHRAKAFSMLVPFIEKVARYGSF
jgi:XTP/dITP diphosphohydrolase